MWACGLVWADKGRPGRAAQCKAGLSVSVGEWAWAWAWAWEEKSGGDGLSRAEEGTRRRRT